MKEIIYTFIGLAAVISSLLGANYIFVGLALADAIKSDLRNIGIEASAHYENYISPSVLVFDLKNVSETNGPVDVFRVFFAIRIADEKQEF